MIEKKYYVNLIGQETKTEVTLCLPLECYKGNVELFPLG